MRYLLLLLILLACDSATDTNDVTIEIVSGAEQVGGAGARLPQPVIVRVLEDGQPVRNASVDWMVGVGGGSVDSARTITDAEGRARASWTLGVGNGTQSLTATASGASINIRATAELQIASVSAGYRHTCALSTAGVAYCWGLNQAAQLGDGTEITRASPVQVLTPIRFRKVSAGYSHTCGLSVSGEAFCWGENLAGQLGIGFVGSRRHAPVQLDGSEGFLDISAGYVHTCGVTADRAILCWGSNQQGQLSGTDTMRVRITGHQFQKVATGEFHTCGLRIDNVLMCWGLNSSGELGNSAIGAVIRTPTVVAGDFRFASVAAGVRKTCAIDLAGVVYCWGRNAVGETGLPPLSHSSAPSAVDARSGFTVVGTGNIHSCGVQNAAVFCWGANLGSALAPTPGMTQVPGIQFAKTLSAGFEHTCAVAGRDAEAVAGQVWCWGSTGVAESVTPVRIQFPAN